MPKLTEADRMAIVAGRAAGVPVNELAKRYKVTRQSISNVLATLKQAKHKDAREEFDATVYRSVLRRKSYKAVEAGLDCEDDQYKRGNLGKDVLKGFGDLNGADVNVNIQALVASIPEGWREDFLGPASLDEIETGKGGLIGPGNADGTEG